MGELKSGENGRAVAAEPEPRGEDPVAAVGSGVSPTTAARQIHRSLSAWAERQAETADAPDGDRWSTTLHRSAQSAGSRIMRAEDPAKKKEKALTEIKAKAATFANFQCTQCADALKAILVKAGVKGSIIRITNKPPNKNGFVYCVSRGANISNTNYHVGVVVDGVVYDNQHPSGIARGAWLADFAHMAKPAGGADAFDVSESPF